ncbi:MAG TPA: Ig-like domain-containing protein, partial [Xanthobacteraceae bacterium]
MPDVFTSFGSSEDATAYAINSSGEIVGYYFSPTDPSENRYTTQSGFLYNNGAFTDINDQGYGDKASRLVGITTSGEILGYDDPSYPGPSGFIYNNGTFTAVNDPLGVGTKPLGINSTGSEIVGFYYTNLSNGAGYGFVDNNGVFTTFNPTTPSGYEVTPNGVNASGVIVGSYPTADGYYTNAGFIYNNGTLTTLTDPSATVWYGTSANAINDSGVVVGDYSGANGGADVVYFGFVEVNGVYTNFSAPGADTGDNGYGTFVTGINNAGVIVGYVTSQNGDESSFTLTLAPNANSDTQTVFESSTVTTTATNGVLSNDSDPYGTALTVTGVTNAAHTAGTIGQALSGSYGSLTLNSNGSYSYVANQTSQINAAATGSHPTDTFTYTETDALGYISTSTLSIAVDRSPNSTTHGVVAAQGTSTGRVSAGDTDPDNDSLTVTALSNGTVGTAKTGTYGSLTLYADDTYDYVANNTPPGSNASDTFTYTVSDGYGGTASETLTFSVMGVPAVAPGSPSATFVEGGSAATLDSGLTVSDPNSTTFSSATVAITGGTFTSDGDMLTVSTGGTNITASYNSSTETLTLTGPDTLTDYQSVLDKVTFNSTSQNPTDYGSHQTRTVTWTVNDGLASYSTATATSTIGVTAVNSPPTLSNLATSAHFTQGASAVTLSNPVSVSDPDNFDLASATVKITGGTFAGDGDVLSATGIGSISVSYNSSTETLTLTGSDTLAHYQSVLESITFNEPGNLNPTDYGSDPTRTVSWVLNDGGTSNNLSTTATTTIGITPVNQSPTLSGATNASYTQGGAAATLSGAAAVSDPDNLDLTSATVVISGGTFAGDGDVLSATGTSSISVSYNSSTETLTLTGSDTLSDYQSVLDSITYSSTGLNPTDYGSDPTRTVTWTLNNGGSSNNLSTTATTTIGITPVNQAPTLSGTASALYTQGGAAAILSGAAAVSDPDNL